MRSAVAAALLLTAGCSLDAPADPRQGGPTLVLDVTNLSDRDVTIEHAYEDGQRSGSGEATFFSCHHNAGIASEVVGDYRVVVDGEHSFEGTVPDRASGETFLVVTIRIGPEGEVEIDGPGVTLEPLNEDSLIPGCG